MTGYDNENLLVNDPFYNSLSYPDSEAEKGDAAIFLRPQGCKTQPNNNNIVKEFLNWMKIDKLRFEIKVIL